MEKEDETSHFSRAKNDNTTPNDKDDTSVGENIDETWLGRNENKSMTNEDEDTSPHIRVLDEVPVVEESKEFQDGIKEKKNAEGDEGVGSSTDEMSASADLETTASPEDDTVGFVEDDADIATNVVVGSSSLNEKKAPIEEDEEDKSEDTQVEDRLIMEDKVTIFKGLKEPENEFDIPEAKGDLPQLTSKSSKNDKFSQQNDESSEREDGDRYDGDRKENECGDEKEHNVSITEGAMGESMDAHSQESDSETLIPRDDNFEIVDCYLYEEADEDQVENDERIKTHGPLDDEILLDDNKEHLQECEMDFTRIGTANALSDAKMETPFSYIERVENTAQNEGADNNDQGQGSDVLEEQNRIKNDDKILSQHGDEHNGRQNPEEQPQVENPLLYSQMNSNGDIVSKYNGAPESEPKDGESESNLEEDMTGGMDGDAFYADDDLSSIFSDDGRDMSTIVQENSILREAMMQLRNDNPGGFTDTVSETSDDVDDLYSYRTGGDSKIPTSKLMAGRDFNDAKLDELMREKRDSQSKMRQLEREKAAADRRYRQDKMEKEFLEERFTLKASQLEEEIRNLKQENQRLKRNPQGKGTTSSSENKNFGSTKSHGIDLLSDDEDGNLPGKNGFANDIAMLAKENEKLSEIIDHLLESPRDDSFNDFVDTLDKYVPKEEYIRVENEKLKLETILREKERILKEQERLLEETKFDLEEEIEILRDSLKKAENKNKEKGKLLSQYDIKMMDVKAKFTEKVSKLESRLEQEVSKKVKMESVIINLKKCNENFDKEIQGLKNRVKKLQNNELEVDEKNRREKSEVEGRLSKEAEEKAKLGRNVEALLQDLMQLKNKLLEETEKHRKEKELLKSEFENEKAKMSAAQENDYRRLMSELDEQRKRNEQLSRRMAEIPGETLVSVMENKTEAGMFESAIDDIEPGLLEMAFQEEQFNEPEKDNVMVINDLQPTSYLSNVTKPLDGNTSGDINNLQRKLIEVTKCNSIMQRRNKEIEEENINLKERMERVGRDVHKLRELEDKNEELQEEIARNGKKRNEMQKKQEDMMEEIKDISKTLNKVEGTNRDLSEEVDRLTKKIKTMEEEYTEEKTKLVSSLEKEKSSAIDETEKRLDEQMAKSKKLESEIEDLNADIKTLKDAKRAAEEKFVNDTRELVDRHNADIANERNNYRQLQDELNNNAGAVRRVTEEWEQMLRNAVSRYEEDLQKNEEERRKMTNEFQRQKDEMKSRFDKERGKLELRVQEMERMRSPLELEVIKESAPVSFENPRNGALDEDRSHISNIIAEKHEKIRALAAQRQKLEEKLEQMQKSHDDEKNDLCQKHKKEKQKLEETLTDDYKRRLEESKRYYEKLFDDQQKKHEKEEKELENKLTKEKRELEEKLKQDLSSNLSSRSAGLENKIQDLVSQKVQEQKEITKKVEVQMRNRLKEVQNEKNENKRKFDREKKVLEATIQALTKELEKVKQEKKDLKKKQKKEKADMEEAFENEKKEVKQMWEKCKIDTINQIEEEWSEKLKNEQTKTEIFKDELQEKYETKFKQMRLKFKAEKTELESRLADAASDTNSLAEAKKEMQAALEDEYRRKLQKEKENIEGILQGLRREIERLQEHRKQLQNQMAQRESQAKATTPALLEANSQVSVYTLCWHIHLFSV